MRILLKPLVAIQRGGHSWRTEREVSNSISLIGPKPLKPRARFFSRRNMREFKLVKPESSSA